MSQVLYVLDTRSQWGTALQGIAQRRGWDARIIRAAYEIDDDGYAFVRLHSHPRYRVRDQLAAAQIRAALSVGRMIQDEKQIKLYDNKRGQHGMWGHLMPQTSIFEDEGHALDFVRNAPLPLISKADVGASSKNVRYLHTRGQAEAHIRQIWHGGVPVSHCSSPDHAVSKQHNYVYLQKFIPHSLTYRVNIIGRQRAVFFRRCHADRPLAQTGNVYPALEMTDETADLLAWADGVFAHLGTQWCAIDALRDGDSWRLLETSLCWPWPSPGNCNDAVFFGGSKRRWREMFDVLLDEVEAGVWRPVRSRMIA